ncbi:hypothetical protein [Aneurinibacillus sp. REN35]|uniref:hypothetical protein n=1 Tax=Aneurinibacillus sp. REN35 TaxID=3237286 RepID=UPI003526D661
MLLDDKPLINSYGEELYCPTCAKLLSIGLGREKVDKRIIDSITYSQELGTDIVAAFENMKPMLSMLENGYYLLTRIEMIPTDGDGHFFWNLSSSKKQYHATADVHYKLHMSSGTPTFLLPSQSMQCINEERVNHYVAQIKTGKTMTGLAFYYEGFMSTLLDGHYRAAAAYLENKRIDCLTIMQVTEFSQYKKPGEMYAGGEGYDLRLFNKPKRIYAFLKKGIHSRTTELTVTEVERILAECQNVWEDERTASIHTAFDKRMYPDYLSIAFLDMAGNVSDERINDVMSRQDDEAEFELEVVFKKLQLQEPQRAFELAKKIMNDANWKMLWAEAFRYAATIDSMEVEDLFIKYVIDHEYDAKDVCRRIADEYLNNR